MLACALVLLAAAAPAPPQELPVRVRRIVLHVPGNPAYETPSRRWTFLTPPQTQKLWRTNFGTHWILWTDGTLWPRHPRRGEPAFSAIPWEQPADSVWRAKLAREAAPRYAQAHGANEDSVGIEVAHSGRAEDPFIDVQVKALAWLLRTLVEMSNGRLTPAGITGHKDVDTRPAFVDERCQHHGCWCFVDAQGRPYRRRVDPPEALFLALAQQGLEIPRPPDGDAELRRSEAVPASSRPAVGRQ